MRYVYATKPDYNPTTHDLYETYQLEGDVFHVNYMIQPNYMERIPEINK